MYENLAVQNELDRWKTIHYRTRDILKGDKLTSIDNSLFYALQDVCQRLSFYVNKEWILRLTKDIDDCFYGLIWETKNIKLGITPSIQEYIRMRPLTGMIYILFNFIEVANLSIMPTIFFENKIVKASKLLANNFICWSNDLVSYEKEMKRNNNHNLVLIFNKRYNLTIDDAVKKTTEMCNAQAKALNCLESRSLSCQKSLTTQIKSYLYSLGIWMRGHLEWSLTSKRYNNSLQINII